MKSYVVMADNREKIICVSDDLRLARGLKSWACWMKICGGRFVATM